MVALTKARYIIETQEWKVQPVADDASPETLLANGMSAVHTGDTATAAKMLDALASQRRRAGRRGRRAACRSRRRARARTARQAACPTAAKAPRIMHHELAALIKLKAGQRDQAVALLKDAAQIEESMRPPNGAADPVKPSHELLGEVLLEAGKAADAAAAFDACLLRMPNRARSLMGAARAYAAAGQKDLADARFKTLMIVLEGQRPRQSDHGGEIAAEHQ